jgi:hypothetical protein
MKDTSFGRIVAVLVSPSKTFRAIAERPTWLAPILVLIALTAVSAYVAAPKIDWQDTISTKLQRADREVGPERIEIVLRFLEEYGTGLGLGTIVLLPWIIYPLLALIFLRLLKTIGGELCFRTSLGVLVHGFMPRAVAALLSIPILLTSESLNLYDPGFMTSNLTAFAGAETSLELWILLNSVGLFSLWTIALLVIGYSIAAKITKLRAAACVVGLWAIWIAFLVGLAALE